MKEMKAFKLAGLEGFGSFSKICIEVNIPFREMEGSQSGPKIDKQTSPDG